VLRVLMLAIGACITPQARAPRPDRAAGKARQHHRLYLSRLVAGRSRRLPLITFIASRYGFVRVWRNRLIACLSFVLLAWRLPADCWRAGGPEDLEPVGRNR